MITSTADDVLYTVCGYQWKNAQRQGPRTLLLCAFEKDGEPVDAFNLSTLIEECPSQQWFDQYLFRGNVAFISDSTLDTERVCDYLGNYFGAQGYDVTIASIRHDKTPVPSAPDLGKLSVEWALRSLERAKTMPQRRILVSLDDIAQSTFG